MSRRRNALLWSGIAVLTALLAGTVLLLIHPVLFTGRYYELTVRSIDYGPRSLTSIVVDDSITYDTLLRVNYASSALHLSMDSWDRKPRSFLLWPRNERERTWGWWLATEEEKALGLGDSPAVRERLQLKPGTYRIRAGERLIFYRRKEADGTETQWSYEVEPAP